MQSEKQLLSDRKGIITLFLPKHCGAAKLQIVINLKNKFLFIPSATDSSSLYIPHSIQS